MSMLPLVAMLALAAPSSSPARPASAIATPQDACNIVYGDNWAFLAEAPRGWSSACGNQAMSGTVLTLWPSSEPTDAIKAAMYVTVSALGHESLDDFVKGDIENTLTEHAKSKAENAQQPPMHIGKVKVLSPTRRLVRVEHAIGDRNELVAYIKGPTAYYIVVLTTQSAAMTATYRPAFKAFLGSFSPAKLTFENGARPQTTKH